MACEVTLSAISTSCTESYSGGLKSLLLYNKADLSDVTIAEATGVYTAPTNLFTNAVEFGFNNKDAFSNFTDVVTANPDGTRSTVPTISMEFARMDTAKRASLMALTQAGAELVAVLETAAGTQHLVGFEFGLIASSIDGASGTTRSEKNRFQLTLVGEENNLSYQPATDTDWVNLTVTA
jgi:hypothetical protein